MPNEGTNPCRNIVITDSCPRAMRSRDVWRIDQFSVTKKIGVGYASSVYLATCRESGLGVAIKMYQKSKLTELNLFQVSREIKIHGNIDHKNIIQLWAAFEDQSGIYLVTEYASKGDVFADVERRGGRMTEQDTVRQVIHPFLQALIYLNSQNIIHRDIKPENLLLMSSGVLKVADFGLCIDHTEERPVTRVGTLDYMAPEVLRCPDKRKPGENKEKTHLVYTPLADAWGVGVLTYELIVGRSPFNKGQKKLTMHEILSRPPILPSFVSEGAAHFIRWALTKDPSKRATVQQLVEHDWVRKYVESTAAPVMPSPFSVLQRADSYNDMQLMSATVDDNSPAEVIRQLQVQSLQQTGHLLCHSLSLDAADLLHWRDMAFELSTGDHNSWGDGGGFGLSGAPMSPYRTHVRRRSEGCDEAPASPMPSEASSSSLPPIEQAAAAALLGFSEGSIKRANSWLLGRASPGPDGPSVLRALSQASLGGGTLNRPLSREEMVASLRAYVAAPEADSSLESVEGLRSASFTSARDGPNTRLNSRPAVLRVLSQASLAKKAAARPASREELVASLRAPVPKPVKAVQSFDCLQQLAGASATAAAQRSSTDGITAPAGSKAVTQALTPFAPRASPFALQGDFSGSPLRPVLLMETHRSAINNPSQELQQELSKLRVMSTSPAGPSKAMQTSSASHSAPPRVAMLAPAAKMGQPPLASCAPAAAPLSSVGVQLAGAHTTKAIRHPGACTSKVPSRLGPCMQVKSVVSSDANTSHAPQTLMAACPQPLSVVVAPTVESGADVAPSGLGAALANVPLTFGGVCGDGVGCTQSAVPQALVVSGSQSADADMGVIVSLCMGDYPEGMLLSGDKNVVMVPKVWCS